MSRQETWQLEVGGFVYLALWHRRIEVQIEILPAEHPDGDHSDRPRGSGGHAVFLDHVRGLVRPGVSIESSRAPRLYPPYRIRTSTPRPLSSSARLTGFRPSMSGRRPPESFGGSPSRSDFVLYSEMLDQAALNEEEYNAQIENVLEESFFVASQSNPCGGRQSSGFRPTESFRGPPSGSGLMNELLNQAETGEEEYNALIDNTLGESFVAGAGLRPRDDAGPSRSQSGPSRQGKAKRKPVEGNCSICLAPLSSDPDLVWCQARCGQNFHRACLESWHNSQEYNGNQPRCPVCRAEWVWRG